MDVKPVGNIAANGAHESADIPGWALILASKSIPGETGIVDTIERTIGKIGSDQFKLWFAETFGVFQQTCNCQSIREQWLAKYSYPLTSTPK